jgi:glycosidase
MSHDKELEVKGVALIQPLFSFLRYCGGTFKGIERQLGYVAGMGFDAIWLSPSFTNVKDRYHGY